MNAIFEGPWIILLTGIVIETMLLIALVRTGRAVLLWAIVGVGVLVGGLVIVERAVVTDNERIRQTLDGIATACEANDLNAVLSYVAPEAEDVRRKAAGALQQFKIREARIGGDLNNTFNYQANPPAATATFTGKFNALPKSGTFGHDTFIGRFKVGLVKHGDTWLVVSVEHRNVLDKQ